MRNSGNIINLKSCYVDSSLVASTLCEGATLAGIAKVRIMSDTLFEQAMVVGENRSFIFPYYAVPRTVWRTLKPWTIENGMITPTLRLKRNALQGRLGRLLRGFIGRGCRLHCEVSSGTVVEETEIIGVFYVLQGLMTSSPRSATSLTLRVTKLKP